MTTLDDVLLDMADAGLRMSQIDAAEGAAGNISVYVEDDLDPGRWERRSEIDLPVAVPALVGGWIVVTGSNRRMRDIARIPDTTLGALHVNPGGRRALLYAAEGFRPTSELNTHLLVHDDHVARRGVRRHAVVHAQPLHLTYLSHITRYQDTTIFNRCLFRWQPEMIMEFPEGLGLLPFEVPGSPEQSSATMPVLAVHRAVVWARHGIVARADSGAGKAADLVEYAEAAARYEYLNLQAGEPASGLPDTDIQAMCERLGIAQSIFTS